MSVVAMSTASSADPRSIKQPLLVREKSTDTAAGRSPRYVVSRRGTASFKTQGDAMLNMLLHANDRTNSDLRVVGFWASGMTSGTTAPMSLKLFELKQNVLLEGIFVMKEGSAAEGSGITAPTQAAECIPDDLCESRLESFIVGEGFCPTPEKFSAPHPEGFGGQPVVLRALETALNVTAHPDSEIFCCVARHVGQDGQAGVYCLVSTIPLFDLHFEVLRLVAGGCDRHALVQKIQDTDLDLKALRNGINIEGTNCAVAVLELSSPEISPKPEFAMAMKGHRIQAWQAVWCLEGLLEQWPSLVGEPLVRLFTHMLLEARLILLGEAPRLCRVGLALKAFLWPFKWPHLFLSAPIQSATSIPIAEAPFPMVGALFVRPEIDDPSDPPVFAELGEPGTGMAMPPAVDRICPQPEITLPDDLRRIIMDRVARVSDDLRQGNITVPTAALRIQDGFGAISCKLAEVVISYAREQGPLLRLPAHEHHPEARHRALSTLALFRNWHGATHVDRAFYDAFFQTGTCNMFLKEVVDQMPWNTVITWAQSGTMLQDTDREGRFAAFVRRCCGRFQGRQ